MLLFRILTAHKLLGPYTIHPHLFQPYLIIFFWDSHCPDRFIDLKWVFLIQISQFCSLYIPYLEFPICVSSWPLLYPLLLQGFPSPLPWSSHSTCLSTHTSSLCYYFVMLIAHLKYQLLSVPIFSVFCLPRRIFSTTWSCVPMQMAVLTRSLQVLPSVVYQPLH